MGASKEIEEGLNFTPKFDANGLITAISQDAETGQVLMVAYMNDKALKLTLQTGQRRLFQPFASKALEKRRRVRPCPENPTDSC